MVTDIKTDSTGDFEITADGDLAIDTDSDAKHIENITISFKGNWRQHTLVGVAIGEFLNAPDYVFSVRKLEKRIRLQLQQDDYRVLGINITSIEDINIKARRK